MGGHVGRSLRGMSMVVWGYVGRSLRGMSMVVWGTCWQVTVGDEYGGMGDIVQ